MAVASYIAVVSWLVNVAVGEMTIMRMRTCGQRGCNINPIKTPKSVCTSNPNSLRGRGLGTTLVSPSIAPMFLSKSKDGRL